jgi:uncharacterized protein YjiS (DUF1127 family)
VNSALLRHASKVAAAFSAVAALGRLLPALIRKRRKAGADARTLSRLPDHVLADMGLEKMEIMSGPLGGRETWIVPHRYH